MIIDITLKGNNYFLKIHRKFFENTSLELKLFQADTPLMNKYGYLGIFHIDKNNFGFDGCFKRQNEEDEYIIYIFEFPKNDDKNLIRKMLLTMYLCTYYALEQMHYQKEYFNDGIWDDQSLSFIIFNGGMDTCGYSIGGNLYPWFKKKLNSLSKEQIDELNKYVFSELNRVHNFFEKKDICMCQVTITKESFFIQVNLNGRWLNSDGINNNERIDKFSSHNIDFRSDQEMCFAGIVALNTHLREH